MLLTSEGRGGSRVWFGTHWSMWKWEWCRSVLSDSLRTPWTVAHQAPPSMGFSRQEYCSGLPSPSPGDLLNPGIEPRSPALQADALTSEPPGKTREAMWGSLEEAVGSVLACFLLLRPAEKWDVLGTGSHEDVGWLACRCLPKKRYNKAELGTTLGRTAVT